MKAKEILSLLECKHAKDVFIAECKDGPTQGSKHFRLDAWAMPRSWVRPSVLGYEIKVSRQDFINDEKWPNYLGMCNRLFFVCPKGMIQVGEVPSDAGLIYATAKQLRIAKAAPLRTDPIRENVWRYILMCRTAITSENTESQEQRMAYWREWLERKRENQDLGHRVSQRIAERVGEIEAENALLRAESKALNVFRERLEELGYNPKYPVSQWNVQTALQKLQTDIPGWVYRDIKRGIDALQAVKELVTADRESTCE